MMNGSSRISHQPRVSITGDCGYQPINYSMVHLTEFRVIVISLRKCLNFLFFNVEQHADEERHTIATLDISPIMEGCLDQSSFITKKTTISMKHSTKGRNLRQF